MSDPHELPTNRDRPLPIAFPIASMQATDPDYSHENRLQRLEDRISRATQLKRFAGDRVLTPT